MNASKKAIEWGSQIRSYVMVLPAGQGPCTGVEMGYRTRSSMAILGQGGMVGADEHGRGVG